MRTALAPSESLVCFRVADQLFALNVGVVREVQRRVTIHPAAVGLLSDGRPPEMRGAINVHGQVVPVLDLRPRLHLPPASTEIDTSPDAALILFESRERLLALLADHVTGVFRLTDSADSRANGMVLVNGQIITMLDADALSIEQNIS